jgi:hypothetical protein
VGTLAARAADGDIVDACVVEGAIRRHDLVISSDGSDLNAIAAVTGYHLVCRPPLIMDRRDNGRAGPWVRDCWWECAG